MVAEEGGGGGGGGRGRWWKRAAGVAVEEGGRGKLRRSRLKRGSPQGHHAPPQHEGCLRPASHFYLSFLGLAPPKLKSRTRQLQYLHQGKLFFVSSFLPIFSSSSLQIFFS